MLNLFKSLIALEMAISKTRRHTETKLLLNTRPQLYKSVVNMNYAQMYYMMLSSLRNCMTSLFLLEKAKLVLDDYALLPTSNKLNTDIVKFYIT
jgi:hypothetical protein